MPNRKLVLFVLVVFVVSPSCIKTIPSSAQNTENAPVVDFEASAEPLIVTVQLDESSTVSNTITPTGGSLSLTAADGTVFTLEVPEEALSVDTLITMTAVKSIDGTPLDNNSPLAVQLEPSGLFFDQIVTLTIIPANDIPIKEQIIFGYEGSGYDYHLAVVDPKSKDIKIKLMEFSGAGVGSGSDVAWAAHLQIQASNASTRLWQKFGEFSQHERQGQFLGTVEDSTALAEQLKSTLDQFEDQVVLKEIVAAELDCKHAAKAIKDLLYLGRVRQLAFSMETPGFDEKLEKLSKIMEKCMVAYRVSGESNDVSFSGEICSLERSFIIDGVFPGGSARITFTPSDSTGGAVTMTGEGGGCTQSGSGSYTVTINEDGSGTITWTDSATITCPLFANSRTATFSLPLQSAPDLYCP